MLMIRRFSLGFWRSGRRTWRITMVFWDFFFFPNFATRAFCVVGLYARTQPPPCPPNPHLARVDQGNASTRWRRRRRRRGRRKRKNEVEEERRGRLPPTWPGQGGGGGGGRAGGAGGAGGPGGGGGAAAGT